MATSTLPESNTSADGVIEVTYRDSCECGCGERPNKYRRFVKGHNKRNTSPPYRRDGILGCWDWLHGKTGGGYGIVRVDGRPVYAHRHTFELHVGPIPAGMEIDHLCSNPGCVNPAHLEVVTAKENMQRSRKTVLSDWQVARIRTLGLSPQTVAAHCNVSPEHISRILAGKRRMA